MARTGATQKSGDVPGRTSFSHDFHLYYITRFRYLPRRWRFFLPSCHGRTERAAPSPPGYPEPAKPNTIWRRSRNCCAFFCKRLLLRHQRISSAPQCQLPQGGSGVSLSPRGDWPAPQRPPPPPGMSGSRNSIATSRLIANDTDRECVNTGSILDGPTMIAYRSQLMRSCLSGVWFPAAVDCRFGQSQGFWSRALDTKILIVPDWLDADAST